MVKKLTQREFVDKANLKHNFAYNYERSEYLGANSKITITCSEHGDFIQKAASHLEGVGCKQCGHKRISDTRKLTNDDFLIKAKAVHGDKYSYESCDYKEARLPILITCKIHGPVECNAGKHLQGAGCKKCVHDATGNARRLNTKIFIEKSEKVHNSKYDYSLVDYKLSSDKVKIICKEHGVFEQYASHHLAGQGCQKCSNMGFDNAQPGHVYILKSDNITKVGITNKHPETRVGQISKSSELDFDIETYFKFSKGVKAREVEKKCLIYLRSKYQQVQEVFDGSTECFLNVDLPDLLSFVIPIATQSELEQSSQPILAQ